MYYTRYEVSNWEPCLGIFKPYFTFGYYDALDLYTDGYVYYKYNDDFYQPPTVYEMIGVSGANSVSYSKFEIYQFTY